MAARDLGVGHPASADVLTGTGAGTGTGTGRRGWLGLRRKPHAASGKLAGLEIVRSGMLRLQLQ